MGHQIKQPNKQTIIKQNSYLTTVIADFIVKRKCKDTSFGAGIARTTTYKTYTHKDTVEVHFISLYLGMKQKRIKLRRWGPW